MLWLFLRIWPAFVYAGVLINEISFKGSPEWVEIYNDGETSKDLGGMILRDANNSIKDDISLTGEIGALEYKVFESNKSWLNDTGDSLYLVASDGGMIDQTSFEKAVEGKTWSRVGGQFMFADPSKGSANPAMTPTPVSVVMTSTVTPTPTPTKAPSVITSTTTPTAITRVVTSIATAPSPSRFSTVEVTKVSDKKEEASSEAGLENKLSENIEEYGSVLGTSSVSSTSGNPKEKTRDDGLARYGYGLMVVGFMLSTCGVVIGYLKYKGHGDKIGG